MSIIGSYNEFNAVRLFSKKASVIARTGEINVIQRSPPFIPCYLILPVRISKYILLTAIALY